MLLKYYQVSLVVDPSFVYLCSKSRCLILFQIAAVASYKKAVKSDGKIRSYKMSIFKELAMIFNQNFHLTQFTLLYLAIISTVIYRL